MYCKDKIQTYDSVTNTDNFLMMCQAREILFNIPVTVHTTMAPKSEVHRGCAISEL